jgi:exodeoxyribonuclease V alpha subunit
MDEIVTITAKITGLVFTNSSTGFHILKVRSEDDDIFTVKGSWPGVSIGVGLKANFIGKFGYHEKYGKQFNATSCNITPDKGRHGVTNYLAAHVPSIGPITAAKMYDAFGEDLLKILDNEPERIYELPFLNRVQVASILKEWASASENRTCSIFLSELGLGPTAIKSVLTKFEIAEVRSLIAHNPYCLTECPGISFVIADQAARKLDIGVDDLRRVRAMILFTMQELASSEGHMYCTSDQIREYINNRIFTKHNIDPFSHGRYISDTHLYASIVELQKSDDIVADENRLYTRMNWKHEYESAQCLGEMIAQGPLMDLGDLAKTLGEFEKQKNLTLSDEQRQAFMALGSSRVVVVSGYPGTGKTLLISAFVHLFEKMNKDYVLVSPTGIAAKLLSQVTKKPASTIHRLLGYKHDGSWEFEKINKYDIDVCIVDETSMVDSDTLFHLVDALLPTTLLIMVGDSAQLPSVGAGHVLHNMMNCDTVAHISLTKIYRQEKLSDIITVAHAIIKNQPIDVRFNKDSDVLFYNYASEDVIGQICRFAQEAKERDKNFQVIAPMYDGELGINNLNEELRDVLNPDCLKKDASSIKQGGFNLYEGDRVMIVRNDYDRMIYNGDAGKISRISLKDDAVDVKVFDWFDQQTQQYTDHVFTFKVEEARQLLKVAYAVSVHRCQGQAFDFVIMPMTMQYSIMLYRNLIYTAITRARKKVLIFGDPRAFLAAVANEREMTRNSNLAFLVKEASNVENVRYIQEAE